MKTIILSLCVSFIVHLIYLLGTLGVAYYKTKNYTPNLENEWDNVETLQNEVAFGVAGNPLVFQFTFIGVALICGFIIISYKRSFS